MLTEEQREGWERGWYIDTIHRYGPDEKKIEARLRTFAASKDDAAEAAEVAFRYMLTRAGIDWEQ